MKFSVLCILALFLAGCESKSVIAPNGWRADFTRVLCSYSWDKSVIVVEPNGSAVVSFEKYKSDSTRALDVAEAVIAGKAVK